MNKVFAYLWLATICICCVPKNEWDLSRAFDQMEFLDGTQDYLESSYVTAGDRVYMVGHQDGSFPDLGWHINGEMGGIWSHPIKLLDGFALNINNDNSSWCLNNAGSFRNYPIGNAHHFENRIMDLEVERFQFAPEGLEGLIVMYAIKNKSNKNQRLTISFNAMIDLMPVWLAERMNIVDGQDSVWIEETSGNIIGKDQLNDWFTIINSEGFKKAERNLCSWERSGKGINASISKVIELRGLETSAVKFLISGSSSSIADAQITLERLNNTQLLFDEKRTLYDSLAQQSKLVSGDSTIDQMFRWVKYNTQWLVRDVPSTGRGVSAGIPDYPWWFGTDNSYTIQGMLAAGMHKEALNTIDLVIQLSRQENGNGRIVHEVSTNGVVFNPGNLNTTPNFINALWKAYQWTGSSSIIENYYEDVISGIEWMASQDKDGNGYPDGPGMMEIPGLHTEMIDVVAYQCAAYEAAAGFAAVKDDIERFEEYKRKAEQLRKKINTEWWVPEFGSYADFRASRHEALDLAMQALLRVDTLEKPWSVKELKEGIKKIENMPKGVSAHVVHHNWVINTPMEMGLADPDKAKSALSSAQKYASKYGMFVTGIDRDEQQDKATKWQVFSYAGAVMTLPTGVQAIAEARYGYADNALNYLKMLSNSFSYALPGSMYEVSPDFGMIAQAWNIYAVSVPVVEYFFGIQPRAFDETISIEPSLPSSWNDVSLSNVKVGNNSISIHLEKSETNLKVIISQTDSSWLINFKIPEGFKQTDSKERTINFTGSQSFLLEVD
ncbi:MAG: glycogen debranching protein [Cyclobacteriaceae bacterium]